MCASSPRFPFGPLWLALLVMLASVAVDGIARSIGSPAPLTRSSREISWDTVFDGSCFLQDGNLGKDGLVSDPNGKPQPPPPPGG